MGNRSAFWDAVHLVTKYVSFDQDSDVQVFEVSIRVLGGLLSAHLLALHPDFGMRSPSYGGELLSMAHDLGVRLLPAFEGTRTGLPFPRVNLRHGVRKGCRTDTATAGAGTLILEFGLLSRLTGDPVFEVGGRGGGCNY